MACTWSGMTTISSRVSPEKLSGSCSQHFLTSAPDLDSRTRPRWMLARHGTRPATVNVTKYGTGAA